MKKGLPLDEEQLITPEVRRSSDPTPLLRVCVLIAFLMLVAFPVIWYFHCYDMIPKSRAPTYFGFNHFIKLKNKEYSHQLNKEDLNQWWFKHFLDEMNAEEDDDSLEDADILTWTDVQIDFIFSDGGPSVNQSESHSILPKPSDDKAQCQAITDNLRFDCYPESGANEAACLSRGCCWSPPTTSQPKQDKLKSLNVPYCYYPKNFPTYSYNDINKTSRGYVARLKRDSKSYYPNDIPELKLEVTFDTKYRLHVKITDPNKQRYEVPYPQLTAAPDELLDDTDYDIKFNKPSSFQVIRKSTGKILFDTSVGAFVFADQFIQISTLLPSKLLYGLGERKDNFLRSVNWQQITMFPTDQSPRYNSNAYGTHPFYLNIEDSSFSHGVFLLNSNAMDVILQPAPALTYRTIGGVLDFYFFMGPSPADIVSQYTELIGRPFLPPYWGLGFHLCRFGYKTLNRTQEIMQRTKDAGIPLDVQWNDIDYMDKYRDFTYDKVKYAGLPKFVNDLHRAGMHYVPIIDAGINYGDPPGTYPPQDDGLKANVFIKDASGGPFLGKVWSNNQSVWPDFTHPKAADYWTKQLASFYADVRIDGVWADMNEPSNFVTSKAGTCPPSTWDNPPYLPGVNGNLLYYKTICMSAQHNISSHYNIHSLHGFTEVMATNFALKQIRGKRPFIISRSSYAGLGHYGGHWTGDIFSNWDDLQKSIPGILDFSLFGVPLVGADICGFNGNTTAPLCKRWMELGAFYPFSRNHNTDDSIDQDPVALGQEVVDASIHALSLRYLYLPYLYTLFYRATVYGETVARPLFFEFPKDKATYAIDTQFLWGPSLMILPVMQENITTIYPYFPPGMWYLPYAIKSPGKTFKVNAPYIKVAARGGRIIPMQEVGNTTTESRQKKFGLMVALNETDDAQGELYWDDGDSLGTIEEGRYNLLVFTAHKNTVVSTVERLGAPKEPMILGFSVIAGISQSPRQVLANGEPQHFYYSNTTELLIVDRMTVNMQQEFTITWLY